MSKYWLITSYEDDFTVTEEVEFSVYQREVCPNTHREHWQCFVGFKARKRFSTVRRLYPGCHIEVMRGSVNESVSYCSKEDSRLWGPYFVGEVPSAQAKQDILGELTRFPVKEVITRQPKLWRSVRQMRELRTLLSEPRNHLTEGVLLTGLTGTGKSRIASTICDFLGRSAWISPELQWFDGYDGEELVILDEVRPPISIPMTLRVLDRYPLKVPVKGGFTNWAPHLVIMTSNLSLNELFPNIDGKSLQALRRRITEFTVY